MPVRPHPHLDPHKFNTSNEYPTGGNWDVVHNAQLLLELSRRAAEPRKGLDTVPTRNRARSAATTASTRSPRGHRRGRLRPVEMPRNRDIRLLRRGRRPHLDKRCATRAPRPSETAIDESVAPRLERILRGRLPRRDDVRGAIKTSGHQARSSCADVRVLLASLARLALGDTSGVGLALQHRARVRSSPKSDPGTCDPRDAGAGPRVSPSSRRSSTAARPRHPLESLRGA